MWWDQVAHWIPGLNWALVLVYLRVQGFILILPAVGERVIPARVKVALAMAVAPLLASLVPQVAAPTATMPAVTAAGTEILIGLAAGMLLRILALSLDIATSAIAAAASLSQMMGIQNEAAPHPIGNLLHLGGVAILMVLGFPAMLVSLIADSLHLWPPGALPDIASIVPLAIRILRDSFFLAMMLAAPFTLGGFLFQALSGVINRVMPALPVAFIGAPASILLALLALAVLSPMLVALWADAVLSFTLPEAP